MAEMISCKLCSRMFETNGYTDLCPPCKKRDDEIYSKLRDYLFEHPGAKVFEVSSVLDIPVYYIKRYLKEDRLEIIEKDNYFLRCEKCGSPIRSGRLCDECVAMGREKKAIVSSVLSQRKVPMDSQWKKEGEQKINYVHRSTPRTKRILI